MAYVVKNDQCRGWKHFKKVVYVEGSIGEQLIYPDHHANRSVASRMILQIKRQENRLEITFARHGKPLCPKMIKMAYKTFNKFE